MIHVSENVGPHLRGICVGGVLVAILLALGVAPGDARSTPVLGSAFPGMVGFGQAHPVVLAAGGGPTGTVRDLYWKRWGSARATGIGKGWYRPPDSTAIADGKVATEKVVVFDLGTCKGKRAYRKMKWYFPRYGGRFNTSHTNSTCR